MSVKVAMCEKAYEIQGKKHLQCSFVM